MHPAARRAEASTGSSARSGTGLHVTLPPTLPPPVRLPSLPVVVPLRVGALADHPGGRDEFGLDGVPTSARGEAAPLLWIEGYEEVQLTPGFRVADFASRDGSEFARIAYRLVDGLERLRRDAGSLEILSGYRTSAHNAAVGGVAHSQHLAGRAVDMWSEAHDPLRLARLALQTLGCEIGLGLGPHSLHLDMRGSLATWTYPGAAMPEVAFDVWALTECDLPVPPDLVLRVAEAWLGHEAFLGADSLRAAGSP